MDTINVDSRSADIRERELSNLMKRPFVLDGVRLASVEGLIQGIKYPEGHPVREKAFASAGVTAKRLGYELTRGGAGTWVWWQGEKIPYGSAHHHRVIARAIEASFRQNPWANVLLRSTRGLKLTHNVGEPSEDSSLPADIFCGILEDLRDMDDPDVDICLRQLLHG
ncbi:MAG: hypothetical protein RDU25_01555 [Patescibacteria group bacterium]|nr:hypothetical protein [Patescibacteria group bacterium]